MGGINIININVLVSHKKCNRQTQNAKFSYQAISIKSVPLYSISNPNVRIVHGVQQGIIATTSAEIIEHHDEGEEGHTDDEGQH